MKGRIAGALIGVGLGLGVQGAMAQQAGETECVSAQTDWSVCVWPQPKECWGVSKPKETVNSRDGRPVSVRRGDILLFVTFRPGSSAGEISFTGGYPFAQGAPVSVEVDGQRFDMIPGTDGQSQEWAWPGSTQADAALMTAMRRGSTAIITARSGRGTETKDTFSLSGFTAAMTEAENRCK